MKIRFIAKYYSVVTEDTIEIKFEAGSIEEAHKEAYKRIPDYCECEYDLYVDTLQIIECSVDDGFGNKKKI